MKDKSIRADKSEWPTWDPDRPLDDRDYRRISKGLEPVGSRPPVPFGKHDPATLKEWQARAAETRETKRKIKDLVKAEEWEKAHREEAALLFGDKIDFIRGLVDQVKDEDGKVSTKLIKQLDPKDKALILKAYDQLEKVAHPKVNKQEVTHTHSLADQFKALNKKANAEIEGEVVE